MTQYIYKCRYCKKENIADYANKKVCYDCNLENRRKRATAYHKKKKK